jgi:23S rRNA (cytidine1920-2'-O)/16S rRNA (cytidine1409-2'-O)-methyltransferase
VRGVLRADGEVVCLIKPQFEAGREKVGKKGVVRDAETHREVLDAFVASAGRSGFAVRALTFSPIKGPEGNIEFLGHLVSDENGDGGAIDTAVLVAQAHQELNGEHV